VWLRDWRVASSVGPRQWCLLRPNRSWLLGSLAKELAKAVRDLDGPIYIHCHHGKHRSPAAASAACVPAGLLPPAIALSILELAGTSPNYKGLYPSAGAAKPLTAAELDNLPVVFHETVDVPPMAGAMVALEHTHDHIKKLATTGWKPPADHPDIDPAHEALLLREHFAELLRLEEVRNQPEAFVAMLRESEATAGELEKRTAAIEPCAQHGTTRFTG